MILNSLKRTTLFEEEEDADEDDPVSVDATEGGRFGAGTPINNEREEEESVRFTGACIFTCDGIACVSLMSRDSDTPSMSRGDVDASVLRTIAPRGFAIFGSRMGTTDAIVERGS